MPKIGIFALRTQLWGVTETHRAGIQGETFLSLQSNTYILYIKYAFRPTEFNF